MRLALDTGCDRLGAHRGGPVGGEDAACCAPRPARGAIKGYSVLP
jgi:hypothetical protein